jgi:hypothetical protein
MMEILELGPVNLLRTIFIILLIYYGIKLLWPFVKRMMNSQEQSQQSGQRRSYNRRGRVTVERPDREPKSPSSENLGDFVDYEEIK